jgi:hypothetical protein
LRRKFLAVSLSLDDPDRIHGGLSEVPHAKAQRRKEEGELTAKHAKCTKGIE